MGRRKFRKMEKKVLVEVLKEYKRRRCLWDITDPDYHNQNARNEALGHILKVWHKIDHTATKNFVKMKITNMRTNYIRQRKRVETSLTSGATGENIFKPSLWYYPYLDFLSANNGNKKTSDDSAASSNGSDDEAMNDVDSDLINIHEAVDLKNENHLHSQETAGDSAAAFGHLVGVQVSKLPEMQRWIAEKLISDVLFHAKLSQLTETSTIEPKQQKSTVSGTESDMSEVSIPADIAPKEEPDDFEEKRILAAEDIKIEENETENAVKFLQMY